MKKRLIRVLGHFLAFCIFLFFGRVDGYSIPRHVKTQLIVEVESIKPGKPFCVALALTMEEGWHTYWRNPGDSGLPTTIKWKLPQGFSAGEIQWPYPQKYETSGVVSFGFEDKIFLITEIVAPNSVKPESVVQISASVDWLVCKEECVPEHADLNLEIPVKDHVPRVDPKWVEYFRISRANLPKLSKDWDIIASVKGDKIVIQASSHVPVIEPVVDVFFFPEAEGIIDYAEPQTVKKRGNGYAIEMKRSKFSTELPPRLKGILYSSKGWDNDGQIPALLVDVSLKME